MCQQVMKHLTGVSVVRLMRAHAKTIRGLACAMSITQTRVREARRDGVQGVCFVMDWMEAIVGDPFAGWAVVTAVYGGRRSRPV